MRVTWLICVTWLIHMCDETPRRGKTNTFGNALIPTYSHPHWTAVFAWFASFYYTTQHFFSSVGKSRLEKSLLTWRPFRSSAKRAKRSNWTPVHISNTSCSDQVRKPDVKNVMIWTSWFEHVHMIWIICNLKRLRGSFRTFLVTVWYKCINPEEIRGHYLLIYSTRVDQVISAVQKSTAEMFTTN